MMVRFLLAFFLRRKLSVASGLSPAVILNQHLTEALRRLRKSSSEFNVDRRLVTNVLLTFLATPRGDSKRFEMLSVIASVLSWDDGEREKAGLQRIGATGASTSNSLQATSSSIGKSPIDLAKGDETEVRIQPSLSIM